MENVMRAMDRVPVAAEAGVKRVINGPMIWSPDSNVILGPVPELKNYFVCGGIIPGFSQSAGMGLMVAQWLTTGEMEYDMFPWDIARFRPLGQQQGIRQGQGRRPVWPPLCHPLPERGTRRGPSADKTRPVYEMQKEMGAVFGLNYGWEHPQWFAGRGGRQGYQRLYPPELVGPCG